MRKAMIFPIHKKWVDMIFDGSKKYEFRNKLPKHLVKGMKIYFYETLGKIVCGDYLNGYVMEGLGMIVGEATVESIRPRYEEWDKVVSINVPLPFEHWDETSTCFGMNEMKVYVSNEFKDYKYAIELINVIKYDEEWQYDAGCNPITMIRLDWLNNVPLAPIPKEEFILWNKAKELSNDECFETYVYEYLQDKVYSNNSKSIEELAKINAPIQAPIYVVEREG